MQEQFLDRLLTCVDCHGEFIFTAGEQLFFFDKQFKNDPKRCKPCKSRRSGLAAAANGTGPAASGLSRTETRTTCSECSVETTVPFKPTQGRPVLCRQCFQLKNRAAAPIPTAPQLMLAQETVAPMLTETASLLPPIVTLVAAAAAAIIPGLPPTSIASPAELAYVASLDSNPIQPLTSAQTAAHLIANTPAELLAPKAGASDLSSVSPEAPAA